MVEGVGVSFAGGVGVVVVVVGVCGDYSRFYPCCCAVLAVGRSWRRLVSNGWGLEGDRWLCLEESCWILGFGMMGMGVEEGNDRLTPCHLDFRIRIVLPSSSVGGEVTE